MSAQTLITEHLDLWTGAVTKKSSSSRGSNGKVELAGIKKLRELILSLAMRGKLVRQNSEGPSAASLLVDIEAKKKELHHAKIVKKPKKLCQPQSDEAPWALPNSWEWIRLPDVYYPISPSCKKLKSSETLNMGQFPVVDQGQSYISGYTDDASLVIEIPHPVIVFGDHTTARKYIDFNFVPGADGTKILCPILVSPRFFYLQLLGYDLENRGYARHFKVLNENFFALPPLEEQHRIVQEVDELMALCDRLGQQTSDQLEAHETLVDTLLSTLIQPENANELADNWTRLAAHFDTLFTTEQSIEKLKQTILQLAVMGRLVEQMEGDESVRSLLKQHCITSKPCSLHGWAEASLGSLGKVIGGSTPTKSKGEFWNGKIPWVSPKDMKRHLIKDSQIRVTEQALSQSSLKLVPTNSLVMVVRGMILAHSFPVAITGCEVTINQDMKALTPPDDICKYLLLYLQAAKHKVVELVDRSSHGTCKLVSEKLWSLPVLLPPLKEQHRIVQKVDELMALCDQLKERLNQASATRCQLAEAIVEKGLSA